VSKGDEFRKSLPLARLFSADTKRRYHGHPDRSAHLEREREREKERDRKLLFA
jgi:hypothetical protein